jgi:hypothetical protein
MSKMGSHDPFGQLKHKLWPKEGLGVKLTIWLPTIKSRESPRFLRVQVTCDISLESSQQRLKLCLRPLSIEGLHSKLWAHKVVGILVVRISGLPFGSPKTKCHLDVRLMERHIVYYKGEGGGFPQVRAVVNLVSPIFPCFVLTPKVLQLWTNHLVFGFV